MWEQLNALFLRLREVRAGSSGPRRPHYISRLVIDGVHLFEGVTDETMGHGEGWQYLQTRPLSGARRRDGGAGRSALQRGSQLLPASHIEWVGLAAIVLPRSKPTAAATRRTCGPSGSPSSCCSTPSFRGRCGSPPPASSAALRAIAAFTARGAGGRAERIAGRLHASLDYGQVDEILSDDPHAYLEAIAHHCAQIHAALYQSYIMYPIESALPA